MNDLNDSTRQATPESTIPFKSNFSYSIGMLGSTFVYGMTSVFMTIFFTDVFGISAAAISIIYFVCRFFDAVNDPFMGTIIDRTTTRWGRFRPYLLFATVPYAVIFMLTYYTPDVGYNAKVAWAFGTVFLLHVMATVVDVPYHSMQAIISSNSLQQSKIGALKQVFGVTAFVIVAVAVPQIVKRATTPQQGYFQAVVFLGVFMLVCHYTVFFSTRRHDNLERLQKLEKSSAGRFSIKETLSVVLNNRPLISLVTAYMFIQISLAILTLMVVYIFKYYLDLEGFYPVFIGIYLVAMIPGAAMTPLLTKRLGKKNVLQICNIVGALAFLLMFFITLYLGPVEAAKSVRFGLLFFIAVTGSFLSGPVIASVFGMFPDTVAYAEWKTGIRSEGLIFAVMNFMLKSGVALGGSLAAAGLSFIDYVPNEAQTESTLFGILVIWMILPFTAKSLAGISMLFYDLDEKKYAQIVQELGVRYDAQYA